MLAHHDNSCPSCGQTLPSKFPLGVKLTAGERRIVQLVLRAGKNGIEPDRLFELMYAHRRDGGPLTGIKVLHVRINILNAKLRTVGKMVRAPKGAGNSGYVLKDLAA
jgi:hypothetical protein